MPPGSPRPLERLRGVPGELGPGGPHRNRPLAHPANRLAVPVVAIGNVHHHRPELHRLQDVPAPIRNRPTLDKTPCSGKTHPPFGC